jgi:hypothetical protein
MDQTGATLFPGPEYVEPKPGELVVVGTTTWKLERGSKRAGQFVDHGDREGREEGRVFEGGEMGIEIGVMWNCFMERLLPLRRSKV